MSSQRVEGLGPFSYPHDFSTHRSLGVQDEVQKNTTYNLNLLFSQSGQSIQDIELKPRKPLYA